VRGRVAGNGSRAGDGPERKDVMDREAQAEYARMLQLGIPFTSRGLRSNRWYYLYPAVALCPELRGRLEGRPFLLVMEDRSPWTSRVDGYCWPTSDALGWTSLVNDVDREFAERDF
jgi:hypothetical protein